MREGKSHANEPVSLQIDLAIRGFELHIKFLVWERLKNKIKYKTLIINPMS